jgi:hypothetical protein
MVTIKTGVDGIPHIAYVPGDRVDTLRVLYALRIQVRLYLANIQQKALSQYLNLVGRDYFFEPRCVGIDRPDEIDAPEEKEQGHDAEDYDDLFFHFKGERYGTLLKGKYTTRTVLLPSIFWPCGFVRIPHPLNNGVQIDRLV